MLSFLWVALASDKERNDGDVPTSTQEATLTITSSRSETPMPSPTHLILYGPPDTGKAYATAREAEALCGEDCPRIGTN